MTTLKRRFALAATVSLALSMLSPALKATAGLPLPEPATACSSTAVDVNTDKPLDGFSWTPTSENISYIVYDERGLQAVYRGPNSHYQPTAEGIGNAYKSYAFSIIGVGVDGINRVLATVRAIVSDSSGSLPNATAVTSCAETIVSWAGSTPGSVELPSQVSYDMSPPSAPHETESTYYATSPVVQRLDSTERSLTVPVAVSDTATVTITTAQDAGDSVARSGDTVFVLSPSFFDAADATTPQAASKVRSPGYIRTSEVSYQTYIPEEYVDAPDAGTHFYQGMGCESGDGSDYRYGGDNRGFSTGSAAWRTNSYQYYDWRTNYTASERFLNSTKRYKYKNGKYTFDSARNASKSKWENKLVYANTNEYLVRMDHSVHDPFCNSNNAIDYKAAVGLQFSGYMDVRGSYDQAPNHQLLIFSNLRDGRRFYTPIVNWYHREYACLNKYYAWVTCQQRDFQYVGNPIP